jgi:hypothetical protein
MREVKYWMGRRIESLTREELIEVVNILCSQVDTQMKRHHKDLKTLSGLRRNNEQR